MNLGDATVKSVTRESALERRTMEFYHAHGACDGPLIAYVGDIGSRPEISRGVSKRSVAASDDYHSASDYASSLCSSGDRATPVRWSTPPSQSRSPDPAPDHATSEASLPPRGVAVRRERNMAPRSIKAEAGPSAPTAGPSIPRTRSRNATASDVGPPTPGVDDTPYIRYAIDQITRNDVDPVEPRRPTSASSLSSYPVERIVPPGFADPQPPRRGRSQRAGGEEPVRQPHRRTFIPVDHPDDSARLPNLTHRPLVLRSYSLAPLALLCFLMMAALIFCSVRSNRQAGLWDYVQVDGPRFFVFSFLPQILATVIMLYVLGVQTALTRLMPFVLLASGSVKSRSRAPLLDLRQKTSLFPHLSYFRAGQPLIGLCMIVFWLSIFTVPLQASLFQVRLVDGADGPSWRWVTVEPVAWLLVALYALFATAALTVAAFLFRRRTGLRWDADTLADLIVLLQHSNALDPFEGTETLASRRSLRQRLAISSNRLGYWKLAEEPSHIFYAIAEEGAPTRRYSVQRGRVKAELSNEKDEADRSDDIDLEGQRPRRQTWEGNRPARIRSPLVRYRFIPWFLRDSVVVACIIVAFVLLVAFLVVSFVNGGVDRGFRPLLDATPSAMGFSPPGFLYSFVPSLIGTMLFLFWRDLHMAFCALQPFAALAEPGGASAEQSLLLDYPSCPLGLVSLKAAAAGHWKVAWISFVALLSLTLPVLGGGVFWAIYFPADLEVRMIAHMPAFIALVVFFAIYCLSFAVIWPRRKRYLPHDSRSLAELTSFLYRSSLLRDPIFREPTSKTDLVTRLLSTPPGQSESTRYGFGVYRGMDDKEHLGIDRI